MDSKRAQAGSRSKAVLLIAIPMRVLLSPCLFSVHVVLCSSSLISWYGCSLYYFGLGLTSEITGNFGGSRQLRYTSFGRDEQVLEGAGMAVPFPGPG